MNSVIISKGNLDMKLLVDYSQESKLSDWYLEKKDLLWISSSESIHTLGLKSGGKGHGFEIRSASHLTGWRS